MNNEKPYEIRVTKRLASISLKDGGTAEFTQISRRKIDGNDKDSGEERELQVEFIGPFLLKGITTKKTHRIVFSRKAAKELLHGMYAIDAYIQMNRRFFLAGAEVFQKHSSGIEYGATTGEKANELHDIFIIDAPDIGYARFECLPDTHPDILTALAHFG